MQKNIDEKERQFNIYIRVDGNEDIATGHVMRCLTIANACMSVTNDEANITFVVSDENSEQLLIDRMPERLRVNPEWTRAYAELKNAATKMDAQKTIFVDSRKESNVIVQKGTNNTQNDTTIPASEGQYAQPDILKIDRKHPNVHILNLHTDYKDLETDFNSKEFQEIDWNHVTCFLVDSYNATHNYLHELMQYPIQTVAYIDDLERTDLSVDVVINYDVCPNPDWYKDVPTKLLGLSYTPLREDFVKTKSTDAKTFFSSSTNKKLLLTAGGAYTEQAALILLPSLLEWAKIRNVELHLLMGTLKLPGEALRKIINENKQLTVHAFEKNMAHLLSQFDMVLSAAGTTLYEACALGVSSVSFSLADNQIPSAKGFEQIGLIPYAGDIRSSQELEDVGSRLYQSLDELLDDVYRMEHSKKLREAIDGKGAERIAREILQMQ